MSVEDRNRQFELDLKRGEANCDPLSAWWDYIIWLEDEKLTSQKVYGEVLMHCIHYFLAKPEYNGDIRLTKIFIKSASVCKDPLALYKHMLEQNIGTQFALLYEQYATTLYERGHLDDTMAILEKGIHAKAKPSHLLQSKLDTLQGRKQVDSGKTGDGVQCCYPKDMIYPPDGKEMQLEQVRALLPQYQPIFPEYFVEGECDMELTEAFNSMVPISDIRRDLHVYNSSQVPPIDQDPKFEQQMHQLMLDGDNCSSPLSLLRDQENIKPHVADQVYGFTPDTLGGGLNWPGKTSIKNGSFVNTKLSFTDAESMLSMSSHSHTVHNNESSAVGFNISSDLERKAKLLCLQHKCETASSEQLQTIDRKHNEVQISNRKVLQPLPKPSFYGSSFNPSASQSSFSIYEDTHGSSFIPFSDSMHTSTTSTKPSCFPEDSAPPQSYSVPLGAPLHSDQPFGSSITEQTFTQFDIAHPKNFEPISTPKTQHSKQDLTFDLSVILDDKVPQTKSCHLSTISEEPSGSSKSTTSLRTVSSSGSSNSSSQSHVSGSTEHQLVECNPFLPDMVNRMLNSLGGMPQHAVQVLPDHIPPIVTQKELVLGGQSFYLVSLLTKGTFADIYLAQTNDSTHVLKVHKTSIQLEVAIINQLQCRLQRTGLGHLCNSFQQYSKVYQLPNCFISVSMYHHHGSVQDTIDKSSDQRRALSEQTVLFLSLEMISVVETLHQCGIIHADLKPSHFLLRDLSGEYSHPNGLGLLLIDFRQSIDTRQFAEEQLFIGIPHHSVTLCSEMVEGHPWKWKMDYFGLAMCLLALIIRGNPQVIRNESGYYTWSGKPFKKYDTPMWQELIKELLNVAETVSLSRLAAPLREKFGSVKDQQDNDY